MEIEIAICGTSILVRNLHTLETLGTHEIGDYRTFDQMEENIRKLIKEKYDYEMPIRNNFHRNIEL